jgi:hypothetical protein
MLDTAMQDFDKARDAMVSIWGAKGVSRGSSTAASW